MSGPAVAVRVRHDWPDEPLQVGELRPTGSSAVLLDWPATHPVDAGVPEPLAAALAAVLVGLGSVAFRWAGDCPWPADRATPVKAPSRGLVRAVIDRATGGWASDVVVTDHPAVAQALFEHDWELQGQAALVFQGRQRLDSRVLADLATRRDWRDYAFVPPVSLLLAPAVDGDGILVAAGTPADLRRLLHALETALDAAAITLDLG